MDQKSIFEVKEGGSKSHIREVLVSDHNFPCESPSGPKRHVITSYSSLAQKLYPRVVEFVEPCLFENVHTLRNTNIGII